MQLWKLQAAELRRVLKREVEPAKTSRHNSAVERKARDANESDLGEGRKACAAYEMQLPKKLQAVEVRGALRNDAVQLAEAPK